MITDKPLDVLFLVDFSEFSFRTIPFVAELADSLSIRLTLLHVVEPGGDFALATERLSSFFPEADRYLRCDRLVTEGTVIDVVTRRAACQPIGLLLAPASNALPLPWPGHASLRLELLERIKAPVWSFGPSTDLPSLGRKTKHVACWVDVTMRSWPHVPYAIEYAKRMGAELHLLTAIPEATNALAARDEVPLHPEAAREKLLTICGPAARQPTVSMVEDDSPRARLSLLQRTGAEVLFVAQEEVPAFNWFGARPMWLRDSSCAVVMLPMAPHAKSWQLQQRQHPWHPLETQPRAAKAS